MKVIDFTLTHDGDRWIATRGSLSATGATLEELDRNLIAMVEGELGESDSSGLRIRMTFDNSAIPEWIRQYSNHYFNRIVDVARHRDRSFHMNRTGEEPCRPR